MSCGNSGKRWYIQILLITDGIATRASPKIEEMEVAEMVASGGMASCSSTTMSALSS